MAQPPENKPLEGSERLLASLAVGLATFMNVLDTSIANVSIPAIAGDLGVSPNQGTWVITSYAVANAISVPLTGWLTQRFGQVRLFLATTALFIVASLLCGLSFSMPMLIFFRVVQGAVAGPMIPLSQTLLLSTYPREKAGVALATFSLTVLVAPVVGPLLGGWITDNFSWPWIFWINVPVGVVALGMTWMMYRDRETPRLKKPIDTVGLVLLVVWVGALQLMLDKGKELDWFASTEIVVLAVAAAFAFCLFLVWELTDEHPVVDLSLFKNRNFTTGTSAVALAYGAYFGSIVLLPLWLQQYMGYTATDAGIVLAPVGLLAIFLTPIVGRTSGVRIDPRYYATLSLVIFAVVAWMRSRFNTSVDLWTIVLPTILQGAAVSAFFIPLVGVALGDLRQDQIASGSGLNNFLRITAGAFATSSATTLWENRAALHHAQLVEHITPGSPATNATLDFLASHGLNEQQRLAFIDRLVTQQAFTLSALDLFYASAIVLVLLIPLVWMARPPRRAGGAAAAGAH
ncbi:MAG TPA: DHA2 family efflux MFS transporter permease subunit [Burkholderiales bacterium]|nr:DHA2 family efflux MFS transporter permease subunit [Burkholderiales bacterium]